MRSYDSPGVLYDDPVVLYDGSPTDLFVSDTFGVTDFVSDDLQRVWGPRNAVTNPNSWSPRSII